MDSSPAAGESLDSSSVANAIRLAILVANLATYAVQLPLSLLNIVTIWRTSLLHRNLKFVLLVQSAAFCLFAVSHAELIGVIFLYGNDHWLDGVATYFLNTISTMFIIFIGHVLIIERLMATLLAHKYEHWRSHCFSVSWFCLAMLFCVYGAYQQTVFNKSDSGVKVSVEMMAFVYILLGLSLLEILVFSLLGAFNLKRYREWLKHRPDNFSERYQMAENVRTARQLGPTFTLHFANLLLSASMSIAMYYGLMTEPILVNVASLAYCLWLSISNTMIEYTLISRHPILRKNALHLLAILLAKLCCASVNRVEQSPTEHPGIIQSKLAVAQQNEAERHFQMLRDEWGEG